MMWSPDLTPRSAFHPPRLAGLRRIAGAVAAMAIAPAFLLATPAAAADAHPWQRLDTPRFTVLSQLPEPATRAWAAEFDRFVRAFGGLVPTDEAALAPLTLVFFADQAEFAPYLPDGADGKRAPGVAGTYAARATWSVIATTPVGDEGQTREVIFHEGTHWMTGGDGRARPVWSEEGLAEVCATFRIDGDEAVWGELPPAHLPFLRGQAPMPLERLVAVQRGDVLFTDHTSAGLFYAESWALVHYLMFGVQQGGALEAAPGGRQIGVSDGALAGYVSQGCPHRARRTAAPASELEATAAVAGTAEVEAALARLALGSGHPELAQAHGTRAIELAPTEPLGWGLLAELAADVGDGDSAQTAAEEAVRLGSGDAAVFLVLAENRLRAAGESGELAPAQARQIADWLGRALEASPHVPTAYQNLARVACSLAEPAPRDLALLAQGRRLFPHDGELLLGEAMLAAGRGARGDALRLLHAARDPAVDLSEEGRAAAREMTESLAAEERHLAAMALPAAAPAHPSLAARAN